MPAASSAAFRPRTVRFLALPLVWAVRNRVRRAGRRDVLAVLQACVVGGAIWGVLAAGAHRMFRQFAQYPEIVTPLLLKTLAVALLVGFGLSVVAATIAGLNVFYQARDTRLHLVAPVDWLQHFLSQFGQTALHGSWGVVLVFTPVLAAAARVLGAGWRFAAVAVLGLPLVLVAAAAVGSVLALLLARAGGAQRAKTAIGLGAAVVGGTLAVLLRTSAPAQMLEAANYGSVLGLMDTLNAPTAPFLPTEWLARALVASSRGIDALALGALVGAALAATTAAAALYGAAYRRSLARLQTAGVAGRVRAGAAGRVVEAALERALGPGAAQVALKDLRRLRRDTAEWSNAVLSLFALAIYFYNLQALPLRGHDPVTRVFTQALGLLNLGVAGLLLASIAARYLLPSISLEAPGLWLLRMAPTPHRTVVRVKIGVGVATLMPVAVGMAAAAAAILHPPRAFAALALALAASSGFGVVALAVWFGARHPRFDARNPAEIASSSAAALFTLSVIALSVASVACATPYALTVLGAGGEVPQLAYLAALPLGLRAAGVVAGLALPLGVGWWAARAAGPALAAQCRGPGGPA